MIGGGLGMGGTSGPTIHGSSGRATVAFLGSVESEHTKEYVVYTINMSVKKHAKL